MELNPEDLPAAVGATSGPTAWRTITQEDIDAHARLTGDHQWIHVDVERAGRESPFGTTIAHGSLTLAIVDGWRAELTGVGPGFALGVNYGFDRVRFPAPVPSGARIRASAEITGVTELGDGWTQVTQRYTVEIEGAEKPAVVADTVVRLRAAAA